MNAIKKLFDSPTIYPQQQHRWTVQIPWELYSGQAVEG